VIAPTNLGSGGCYGDDHGGGAIKLTVLGTTAVHGAISAAGTYGGSPYYGPAGGSVFLTTRSLTGAGTIGANGTIYKPNGDSPGGGGRVAVILTGSTDIGDVKLQAYTGTNKYGGAGGTVYLEHTGHTPNQGKLIVDYNDIPPMDRTGCITLQNGVAESSYTFSEIILTNGGVYALDTNDALTVTSATTIRGDPADGYDGIYIWGALNLPPVFTSYSNYFIAINASDAAFNPGPSLTVITNSILRVNAPFTLNCPLTIAPGGVMDHSYNSSLEVSKINLVINGDLDIQAGGEINVDGKGYYAQYGPGKPGANSGAGYGGMGGHHNTAGTFPGTTYGSITAPTNIGSGGYDANSYGGGAVILAVNGATTLNGMILARPASAAIGYQGSGGSVFLTTDTLTGSGTINAGSIAGAVGTGGGGRVAVILTDGNDFGNIVMTAYSAIASHVPGAPGTVYTQTMDQGPGGGTLVINASNIISAVVSSTLINSNVTDCMVGTVLITNAAKLRIDTNQTLAVNRDWINTGGTNLSFIANTGSTVIMGSTNTATVSGSNTFYNLTCTNSGKTVRFTAGTTNFVTAQLALGPRVALESTVDNSWWYLTLDPGGTQQIKSVAVQDSNAGGGQELVAPKGSVDLGNNVNWMFQRYAGTVFCGQ